jgi:hypothetical protein
MKQTWTDNPGEIYQEISTLIKDKVPLTLYQNGAKAKRLYVQGAKGNKDHKILVFAKQKSFNVQKGKGLFLYGRNGDPMKGFNIAIKKESKKHIGATLPKEIFKLERRKNHRVITPGNSMVACMQKGGGRLKSYKILNVSTNGALIIGPPGMAQGSALTSLTLNLFMQFATIDQTVIIPEASIAWEIENYTDNFESEYGIKFMNIEQEIEDLEYYISLRKVEENGAFNSIEDFH